MRPPDGGPRFFNCTPAEGQALNHKQLIVLWIGICLAVLIGMCPPWTKTFSADGIHTDTPLGHAPLFAPPTEGIMTPIEGVGIDAIRLSTMLGLIAAVTVAAVFSFRKQRVDDPSLCSSDRETKPVQPSTYRKHDRRLFWVLFFASGAIHFTLSLLTTPNSDSDSLVAGLAYSFTTVLIFGGVGHFLVGSFTNRLYVQACGWLIGVVVACLVMPPKQALATDAGTASETLSPATSEAELQQRLKSIQQGNSQRPVNDAPVNPGKAGSKFGENDQIVGHISDYKPR